eukprot:CAMPEP_0201869148 /NCGR_PEP_ID=MMETSP0902-20130614/2769_1 /ASSEMBLY_ACC=CAM_ASM_000551 /TAXON_ID=420261 /ORGANISM="Thalassiosira antarctica, Strain CCMP982" /LENGTH=425 /DNA_ID=CAMNT_0048394601 /DNA_START=65 /DNA_END=1342 /DNA_ORIENTATION=-
MFCPACEEEMSSQPDGICLTCGEELISPPTTNNNTNRQSQSQPQTAARQDNDTAATTAMALLASSMENPTGAIHPSSFLPLLNQLRGRGDPGQVGDVNVGNGVDDLAGILPPEALNPQAGTSASRPVSQAALDNLKRIVLTPQSSELFDAQIRLFESRPIHDLSPPNGKKDFLTLNAVPGEFGPIGSPPRTAAIVVCCPRTTKGGKLSSQTLSEMETLRQHRMPFIAYVERGDGVTFVQKAMVCQRAGVLEKAKQPPNGATSESLCLGVIVGNTAASSGGGNEVWPYVMQDTKKEAQTFGLKVPVVMIRREDGMRLVQWAKRRDESNNESQYTPCRINIHSKQANSHTCPVCTDSYVPGATIIRLPLCGHIFHESCALAWLTKHNTCPYCRKEMPTDDEEYEREKGRRERGEAASGDDNVHNFYG